MIHLLGATVLRSFRPFLTKELITKLSNFEFLLLHTIGVLAILGLLFAYEAVIHRSHNAIVKNMMSLNQFQLFCVVVLSIMTVVSSLMVLQAYQFMSSVLAHTMVLKGLSAVMVVFVGAFVFQENYTNIQLFGVLLVTLGVLLVNHASILDKNFWKM